MLTMTWSIVQVRDIIKTPADPVTATGFTSLSPCYLHLLTVLSIPVYFSLLLVSGTLSALFMLIKSDEWLGMKFFAVQRQILHLEN